MTGRVVEAARNRGSTPPSAERLQRLAERTRRDPVWRDDDAAQTYADVLAVVREVRAQLAAARALHTPYRTRWYESDLCRTCNTVWPCPTVRVLGGVWVDGGGSPGLTLSA